MTVPAERSLHSYTSIHPFSGAVDLNHYFATLFLLATSLGAELNPLYLKNLLWIEPDHPLLSARLVGMFLCALSAVREMDAWLRRYVRHALNKSDQEKKDS
jgi:phosphatidylserine synthase 2